MPRSDGHLGNDLPPDELHPVSLGEHAEPDHPLVVVDRILGDGHERLQTLGNARSVPVGKAHWIVVVEPRKDEIKQMACGDRAGQARRSRAARGRQSCANPQLEYRRWESNPHGRFRPEDFKSSASAIPPRRLLRRSIDRQEMPQKERAGPARPVRDRRWSDSQSIGPQRWNSNPRPSTDLTTVTEAFLSCDQSTWQIKGLQQIHEARCEGHPGGVIPCSSRLPPLYPNPWARRAGRYTVADHGTARPSSIIFAGRTSVCGTIHPPTISGSSSTRPSSCLIAHPHRRDFGVDKKPGGDVTSSMT